MKKYSFVRDDFLFGFDNGWLPLMEKLLDEVQILVDNDSEKYERLQLVRADEEFGMLFVDFEPSSDELENITNKYNKKSVKICERCGRKGKEREGLGHWVKTLCYPHYIEWMKSQ